MDALQKIDAVQHDKKVDDKKEKRENGEAKGEPPVEETGRSLTPDGVPLGLNLPKDRKPLRDDESPQPAKK